MMITSALIERRPTLTQKEFIDEYLLPNKPVIVTEATADWTLWWNLQEWNSHFGHEPVQIYNNLFDLIDVDTLSSFIDKHTGDNREDNSLDAKPYVRWYTTMKDVDFVWADETFREIASFWHRPEFLPEDGYLLPFSGNSSLDPTLDLFPGKGLFISGKGACTSLHCDPWASDALLCQLHGTKIVELFSPCKAAALRLDLVVADGSAQQSVEQNAAYEPSNRDTLNPKEILFIPHGWYHSVFSETDSVSLTWNFVHQTTGRSYLGYLMSSESEKARDVLKFFLNPRSGIQ
jgi:hypothetical protein